MIQTLLQVALGGAIGASARYLTNVAAMRLMGAGFPWGTIAVNVVGSFLMGALFVILAQKDATRLAPPGFSLTEYVSDHYRINSVGTSGKNASTTNEQGFYVVVPSGI